VQRITTLAQAEKAADEIAARLGCEIVRIGRRFGWRNKGWGIGAVYPARYDTKVQAVDGIVGYYGKTTKR